MGAVAFAVLLPFALNRTPPASTASTPGTPEPAEDGTPEPEPTAEPEPVAVLAVGDGWTVATGDGAATWPQLVVEGLAADGTPAELTVAAGAGAGYMQPGADGNTFEELVAAQPADRVFDVVVFFGSQNDTGGAAAVRTAATAAFTRAQEAWPDAGLVVVGPPWRGDDPPASVIEARAGVQSAATAAGATFLDPLEEGWFAEDEGLVAGADGGYPTATGHRLLADRILPAVRAALEARTAE
ncbi:MAG TPA: SGNH/GDSL hydrolase family protein [Geodermatophilus sp.]|nr:SGNH/GDSL hydrolase family protein [Geodermatophilus sp.]